jgi:hypothetical protein
MSKLRMPVYLLIAALSLAVAVWQPRDALVEHAGVAIARTLDGDGFLGIATGPHAGATHTGLQHTALQVTAR